MRMVGGIMLAVAVLYLLFGFLAFAGRNWARIAWPSSPSASRSSSWPRWWRAAGRSTRSPCPVVLLILILGAAAILFSPGANAWYARR